MDWTVEKIFDLILTHFRDYISNNIIEKFFTDDIKETKNRIQMLYLLYK